MGDPKAPDPAVALVEGAVLGVLQETWMRDWRNRMKIPGGIQLSRLGDQVGVKLESEIAFSAIVDTVEALENAGRAILYQTEEGRCARLRGAGEASTKPEGTQKGIRLEEYKKANEAWLYEKRTSATEGEKDGTKHWREWVLWVDSKVPGALLGRFLQLVPQERRREDWATAYLGERIRGGLVEEQVTTLLAKLRMQFKNHNRMREVACWYGKHIEDAQKSASRQNKAVRDILRAKKAIETFDVNFRLIYQAAVNTGALDDDWSQTGMTKKGQFLGLAGSFEFGFRPSNAFGTGKNGDMGHAWIYQDLKLVTRALDGNIVNLQMGRRAQGLLASKALPKPRVLLMEVTVPTSKTGRKIRNKYGVKIEETAYLARRTQLESWLLDFFLEWLIRNGPRDDTESVLTRRAFTGDGDSGRELILRQKEVLKVLREAAGSLGLPKHNFKAKSVRKGYATASRDARVDQYRKQALEAMVARGSNWVGGSTVPEEHYIYNYDKVGPFALMGTWEQASEFSIEQYLIRAPGLYDDQPWNAADSEGAIWCHFEP